MDRSADAQHDRKRRRSFFFDLSFVNIGKTPAEDTFFDGKIVGGGRTGDNKKFDWQLSANAQCANGKEIMASRPHVQPYIAMPNMAFHILFTPSQNAKYGIDNNLNGGPLVISKDEFADMVRRDKGEPHIAGCVLYKSTNRTAPYKIIYDIHLTMINGKIGYIGPYTLNVEENEQSGGK